MSSEILKTNNVAVRHEKDSDQPWFQLSLIRAFAVHTNTSSVT